MGAPKQGSDSTDWWEWVAPSGPLNQALQPVSGFVVSPFDGLLIGSVECWPGSSARMRIDGRLLEEPFDREGLWDAATRALKLHEGRTGGRVAIGQRIERNRVCGSPMPPPAGTFDLKHERERLVQVEEYALHRALERLGVVSGRDLVRALAALKVDAELGSKRRGNDADLANERHHRMSIEEPVIRERLLSLSAMNGSHLIRRLAESLADKKLASQYKRHSRIIAKASRKKWKEEDQERMRLLRGQKVLANGTRKTPSVIRALAWSANFAVLTARPALVAARTDAIGGVAPDFSIRNRVDPVRRHYETLWASFHPVRHEAALDESDQIAEGRQSAYIPLVAEITDEHIVAWTALVLAKHFEQTLVLEAPRAIVRPRRVWLELTRVLIDNLGCGSPPGAQSAQHWRRIWSAAEVLAPMPKKLSTFARRWSGEVNRRRKEIAATTSGKPE